MYYFRLVTHTLGELDKPKYHDMIDNPGLLPLKLGNAQNKVNTWTFIQIFDISGIIENFYVLTEQYERIKRAFDNNTTLANKYRKSFDNSHNLVQSFENKIITQILTLNPLLKHRQKRGLIDGLGSIIKSITGNLDQNDARKYETAISTLSENQIKIKTLVKDQITLFQKSIQIFQDNIQNLTKNQKLLNNRIDTIEEALYAKEIEDANTYYLFYIEMILSQIITEFQSIYDILEKIETAITFSKINTFHNSIINPHDLLNEIKSISIHLNDNKLPFEPKIENLLLFEKILEIKSYGKNNQTVFIIKVPIVEESKYNYYHLYALPVNKNNSFKLIIPNGKYLIINEQNHYFSDTPCTEIIPEEFICHEMDPIKTTEDSPCETQLLKFNQNLSNCHLVPVKVNKLKIQKIEANKWIVLSPEHTVASQKCDNDYEKIPLRGTYLIELPPNCEININNNYLRNLDNIKRQFQNIVFPKLNFEILKDKVITNIKPIKLDEINLNEINSVKNALEIEEKKINTIEDQSINFNTINGWTIITYIIILLIIIFVLFKLYKDKIFTRKKKEERSKEEEEPPIHSSPNSGPNPRILH